MLNKFAAAKALQASIEKADARSVQTASTFAARLNAPALDIPPQAVSKFQQKLDLANTEVGMEIRDLPYAEIGRITSMPVIEPMDDTEAKCYSDENTIAGSNFKLFNLQSEALLAYDQYGGLFAPIGVGWG